MSPTHYDVLNLPDSTRHGSLQLSNFTIKRAYHASLLKYHPDKAAADLSSPGLPAHTGPSSHTSVDAITEAYRTLSDPERRAAYDRELRLSSSRSSASLTPGQRATSHIAGAAEGLQVLDLDDLNYDEGENVWWHTCARCGSARGVEVAAADLEEAAAESGEAADGEVLVGCSGCSLWVRITFQTALAEGNEGLEGCAHGKVREEVADELQQTASG